jgi:PAS domain S-box-containing protein
VSTDSNAIRAAQFVEIGQLIVRNAHEMVDAWSRRAIAEQDSAEPAHRSELRNHLPEFLRTVGRALQESSVTEHRHCLAAYQHGEQRWNVGWQLGEVVRDYELLRLVVLESLDDLLNRPLQLREIMALGLFLDESIGASVAAYVAFQTQSLDNIERRMRAVVDAAPDGIITIDSKGEIESVNLAAERILGYRSEELIGRNVSMLMPSPDRELHDQYLVRYRESREPHIIGIGRDLLARHKDGRPTPIHLSIGEFEQNGESFFTAIIHDISERQGSEQALRDSEARFRGTFENAAVGIAHVDFSGRWQRVNERLCEIVGYPREELLRTTFQQITHPDDLHADLEQFERLIRGEIESYGIEKRYVNKRGDVAWTHLTVSLQRDVTGAPEYCIAVVQDIQQRKQYETALAEAREAADRSNRSKSEFLARMSHEIRTPMTAILGFTELLQEQLANAPDEIRGAVNVIRDNGHALLELVNEILDLSRIEAGKLNICREPCRPAEVIAEVDALLRVLAERKRLVFTTGFDGPSELTVLTDAARLRQILVNLVANAIKYTDAGSVECLGDYDFSRSPASLVFRVADTGPGISRAEAERVFEPFLQLEGPSTPNSSGLGLTISRLLAKELGGDITVESEIGQGSVFRLTIAAPPCEMVREAGAMETAVEVALDDLRLDCRILAADDRRENRYLIQRMLEGAGATVTLAEDGAQTLAEIARSTAEGRPYDILVIDMHMPRVDGYQAVSELRAQGSRMPIIALTASAMDEDRRQALNAGCDVHLPKPIDRGQLLHSIASLLRRSARGRRGA